MSLRPGWRFTVAPRFQMADDWPQRLRVGAGVEQGDGGFVPRGPWRPPTADELTALVRDRAAPTAEGASGCISLFRLPAHLMAAWWGLLGQAAGDGRLPGFGAFASGVAEFLDFKGLPLPRGARCDAVVTRPGAATGHGPRPWGGVNLGDEATSVSLIHLTGGEPAEPPVRLTLEPGEGYRLPPGGLVVGSSPAAQEPGVLLVITDGPPSGVSPSASAVRGEMRCVSDGIWLTGGLLGPDECAAVIAAAEGQGFRPAHLKSQGRNNSETFLQLPDLSEAILARLKERACGAIGVPFDVVAMAPHLECYRYQEGDYIEAHCDASEDVLPDRKSDLSLVIYLNETCQGGETVFPNQMLRLRPGLGEGLLFRHSLLHEGARVRQGQKYIVRTSVAVSQVLPGGMMTQGM